MKNRKVGYLYIFPWLIGVLFLTVYPFLNALYISFTDYNMVAKAGFVGFNNYIVLFKDKNFITSLKATLKYTIYTVPLQLTFALFIAFILNFNLKAKIHSMSVWPRRLRRCRCFPVSDIAFSY